LSALFGRHYLVDSAMVRHDRVSRKADTTRSRSSSQPRSLPGEEERVKETRFLPVISPQDYILSKKPGFWP